MLHDSSLETLIKQKRNQVIPNPLEYKEINFDPNEWSNIPSLVPEYCLHLSNHLNAIINYCHDKSKDEST